MIPILYEKTETAFANNGLGRLVDCIECKVTQELGTGVYECDFQYPVTGANFSEIQLGRIIAVTRDDGGQIEPFDIVSYSRPIDGVVSFHAVHTSYRLTKYITSGTNVTTSNLALFMLQSAEPSPIPFTFFAYQTTTFGEMGMADGTPRNVRELIGGGEGSFCSTYNCEAAWSRFTVGFTDRIGKHRDFTIRYGVNMMDYNEETDGSECYTMAVPYWKNGEDLVVGNLVDSGLTPFNRPTAVAMDLSSFFQDQPTTADLEAKALEIMLSGQTNLPKRSIEVDFIRLQDLEDYAGYADLLECNLGDSITVIFPMYNITGTFRIVKVIWDALRDRFDTMTLGSLQTTLAEALGVGGGMTNVGGGGGGGSVVSFTQVLSSGTKIGIITIDGTSTDIYAPTGGGGGGVFYGTCGTAAATAAKAVTCPSFTAADLTAGTVLYVDFTNSNTVASPTLNVNSTGAKDIMRYGTTRPSTSAASSWNAGSIVCMVYDGTYWNIEGWLNTTYSAISQTNIENQSGTSTGLITGQRFTQGLAARLAIAQTLASGTEIAEITLNGTATKLYAPSSGLQNTFYGTSSTAAATANKDVACSDWLDNYGNIIAVTLTNANTAQSPQLKVHGTGASPIMLNGSTSGATWEAGETVTFMRRAYGGGTPCFEYLTSSSDEISPATSTTFGSVKLTEYFDPPGGYIKFDSGNNYPSITIGETGASFVPSIDRNGNALGTIRAKFLPDATATAKGAAMLSTATDSTDTTKAATPSAVKAAYDLASSKSTVSYTPTQTSGTAIGTLTIDNVANTLYAPSGEGGGSYTATAPIDITNNVISHNNSGVGAGSTTAYLDSKQGYYIPLVTYDAMGHLTAVASTTGTLIPVNTSSSSSYNPMVLSAGSWASGLRNYMYFGYTLAAGNTSQSVTISADTDSAYSYRTWFRVADVQAYDVTTFEPVIVDWSCDKVFSDNGSITLTVSIASAWANSIRWFPILTYSRSGM